MSDRSTRILACCSGGGHWVQFKRLLPALEGSELVIATIARAAEDPVRCARRYVITDATRWDRLRLIALAIHLLYILVKERPAVVISTGAAPGYFALRFGKWIGAKTIWVDSIANVEELSMSGQRVRPFADLWLTQWEHLARPDGPRYEGAVL